MMALVLLAVFAGTMLLIVAGYVLVNRRRLAAADALRDRLAPAMAGGPSATILKDEKASDIAAVVCPLGHVALESTIPGTLTWSRGPAVSGLSSSEVPLAPTSSADAVAASRRRPRNSASTIGRAASTT